MLICFFRWLQNGGTYFYGGSEKPHRDPFGDEYITARRMSRCRQGLAFCSRSGYTACVDSGMCARICQDCTRLEMREGIVSRPVPSSFPRSAPLSCAVAVGTKHQNRLFDVMATLLCSFCALKPALVHDLGVPQQGTLATLIPYSTRRNPTSVAMLIFRVLSRTLVLMTHQRLAHVWNGIASAKVGQCHQQKLSCLLHR